MGEDDEFRDVLAGLRARFLIALPARVKEIESAWAAVRGGSAPADGRFELRRMAHAIAGSAAVLGAPQAGDAARTLEQALLPLIDGERPINAEEATRIDSLVEALKRSLP